MVGYLSEVTQREFEAGKGAYRRGDFIGRRGLERVFESELRGTDGRVRLVVDSKQREVDEPTAAALIPPEERFDPGRPGNDLALKLAQHGADGEDIVSATGVTRHEAQLLTRLHNPERKQ